MSTTKIFGYSDTGFSDSGYSDTGYRDSGYSDTGYSDTPLTVKVLVNPMLPKSVNVGKYMLTVTLFSGPKGVTEDICSGQMVVTSLMCMYTWGVLKLL